jgi:hypothetical protein
VNVIYVAGPYQGKTYSEQRINIAHAMKVAELLWLRGWVVICPHANTAWMDGERQMFLDGDLEILSRCDAIFMLKGWRESEGAKAELDLAKRLGLEISYEVNE